VGVALRVTQVDPTTDPRWEAFVLSHPDGLIYHHPGWLRVLTREYRAEPVGLTCEDESGALRGILPLLSTRGLPLAGSARTGRRLSSLPRTPIAGPLSRDDAATEALLGAALERAEPGVRVEIKAAAPFPPSVLGRLRAVPWRVSYRLDLPEDPASIRFGDSRNHGRIRWALNKARKLGVRVRPAESVEDLRRWYAIYLETMRWHAVPPRPYRFFEAMWEILAARGHMRLLLAEQAEGGKVRLLAGSLFLMLGQTVFYAFNGCWRRAMPLRANDAIQWEAIHDSARRGFRHYDLGEVADHQDGLHEFKNKWGAQPRGLLRYYDPGAGDVRTGADEANGHRQLARAAWRLVPPALTAALGERLYGYL
jgi:hypothetical protein